MKWTDLIMAGVLGSLVGAIIYTIDYVIGDDAPVFYWGLLFRWVVWLGLGALVLSIILWAAGLASAWDIVGVLVAVLGALVGAFVISYLYAIGEAIAGVLPGV